MKKVLLTSVAALSAVSLTTVAHAISGGALSASNDKDVVGGPVLLPAEGTYNPNNRFGSQYAEYFGKKTETSTTTGGQTTTPTTPSQPTTPVKPATPAEGQSNPNNRFGSQYTKYFGKKAETSTTTGGQTTAPTTPSQPTAVKKVTTPVVSDHSKVAPGVVVTAPLPSIQVQKPTQPTPELKSQTEAQIKETTNTRYGFGAAEDRNNDKKDYDAFREPGTYPNTNYSYNGSYDDGVRTAGSHTNDRFGSWAQEDTDTNGVAYDAVSHAETFPNTNYSFVMNNK